MATSPEVLLISSVLREGNYTTAVGSGVTSELFHTCKEEWEWVASYYMKYRRTPSKAAFTNHFPDFRVKAVDDTAHFSEKVREAHARSLLTRTLKDTAEQIAQGNITGAFDLIHSSVISIGSQMNSVQDSNLLNDWETVYSEVESLHKRYEERGAAGFPSGFETYDDRTGGLTPKQLTIIGARLGHGKSWSMMRMGVAGVMAGYKVHYSSLEMSKAEVGMRIHNMLSGEVGKDIYKATDLSQGKGFDLHAYKKFCRTLESKISGKFTVSDTNNIGLAEVEAQIEHHRPDVYILDYIGLAKMPNNGSASDWAAIGEFSRGLKTLAKKYDVAIVAAVQLNRGAAGANGKPDTENIAGSDKIGQDADRIIFQRKMTTNVYKMHMAKNRHGEGNFGWWVHMDMERGKFVEITGNQAEKQMEKDRANEDLESL